MAKLDNTVTVEVKLSKEFKEFVHLFTDTLETLTALNDLVANDSCINTTEEYKVIVERMEDIVRRSKKVKLGKS